MDLVSQPDLEWIERRRDLVTVARSPGEDAKSLGVGIGAPLSDLEPEGGADLEPEGRPALLHHGAGREPEATGHRAHAAPVRRILLQPDLLAEDVTVQVSGELLGGSIFAHQPDGAIADARHGGPMEQPAAE